MSGTGTGAARYIGSRTPRKEDPRLLTGRGQFVDVSMVDCLFSLLFDDPIDWYERLGVPVRQGNRPAEMRWPFNMRWGLAIWNWLFLDDAQAPRTPDIGGRAATGDVGRALAQAVQVV